MSKNVSSTCAPGHVTKQIKPSSLSARRRRGQHSFPLADCARRLQVLIDVVSVPRHVHDLYSPLLYPLSHFFYHDDLVPGLVDVSTALITLTNFFSPQPALVGDEFSIPA